MRGLGDQPTTTAAKQMLPLPLADAYLYPAQLGLRPGLDKALSTQGSNWRLGVFQPCWILKARGNLLVSLFRHVSVSAPRLLVLARSGSVAPNCCS